MSSKARKSGGGVVFGAAGKTLAAALILILSCSGVSLAADAPWYSKLWRKVTQQGAVHQTQLPDPAKAIAASRTAKSPDRTPKSLPAASQVPLKQVVENADDDEVDNDNTPEPPLSAEARKVLQTPIRETAEFKQDPRASTVDDSSPVMQTLTSDGYNGPDMSAERTPADESLHREFPMPQHSVQQPMKNPPTVQQYAPPPQPPRRRDE